MPDNSPITSTKIFAAAMAPAVLAFDSYKEVLDICGSSEPSKPLYRGAVTAPNLVKGSRNNPCPCGSGKKFKKCCIGSKVKEGK